MKSKMKLKLNYYFGKILKQKSKSYFDISIFRVSRIKGFHNCFNI